jgi:hypothetical protein
VHAIKSAFRFIGASFSLALKHTQLQEPWFTAGLGGLLILFIGFLPVAAVTLLLGLTPLGLTLIGLLSALILVALLIWGDLTTLQTARAFAALKGGEPEAAQTNLGWLFAHTGDVASLNLILPGLVLVNAVKGFISPQTPSGSEEAVWLPARVLALPVTAVEDLPLKATLARLRQIVDGNLLRFRTNLIPVRPVAAVVQALLTAGGIALAFVVGLKIAGPQTAGGWQRVLAAGIAMLIAWFPTMIGILFGSFTRICYATALYEWTQNVAAARQAGQAAKAQPPAILGQALGTGKPKG